MGTLKSILVLFSHIVIFYSSCVTTILGFIIYCPWWNNFSALFLWSYSCPIFYFYSQCICKRLLEWTQWRLWDNSTDQLVNSWLCVPSIKTTIIPVISHLFIFSPKNNPKWCLSAAYASLLNFDGNSLYERKAIFTDDSSFCPHGGHSIKPLSQTSSLVHGDVFIVPAENEIEPVLSQIPIWVVMSKDFKQGCHQPLWTRHSGAFGKKTNTNTPWIVKKMFCCPTFSVTVTSELLACFCVSTLANVFRGDMKSIANLAGSRVLWVSSEKISWDVLIGCFLKENRKMSECEQRDSFDGHFWLGRQQMRFFNMYEICSPDQTLCVTFHQINDRGGGHNPPSYSLLRECQIGFALIALGEFDDGTCEEDQILLFVCLTSFGFF